LDGSIAQGRDAESLPRSAFVSAVFFTPVPRRSGFRRFSRRPRSLSAQSSLFGGAYLIFLGIKMILDRRKHLSLPSNFRRRTTTAAFRQGVFTNILNPKVALFFSRFSSAVHRPDIEQQGPGVSDPRFTFVTTGTVWCLILAWFCFSFLANDCEQTRRSRNGSIEQPARSLFFLGLRLATAK